MQLGLLLIIIGLVIAVLWSALIGVVLALVGIVVLVA